MPINRNAYIRYQALDKCFRDKHHRYYIDDLVDKCEQALESFYGNISVSRRQIYNDITFMESDEGWRIPLERIRDSKKVYYRYSDPTFSISDQPLTDEEAQQINSLVIALGRYRGLPNNEWMEEVLSNLEYRFNIKGRNENIIGFDQNKNLKGINFLSYIIRAISSHIPIKIEYHNYKNGGRDITFVLHPYYVKQYNNRWFLFGLDNNRHDISNVAIDRIQSVKSIEGLRFIPNEDIDFDHYFDDVVGVTIPKDADLTEIILKFSKSRFQYIISKPIHQSQKTIDYEECKISICVKPTLELEQQILSFGSDVTVLSPDSFRNRIINKIKECLENYFDTKST